MDWIGWIGLAGRVGLDWVGCIGLVGRVGRLGGVQNRVEWRGETKKRLKRRKRL